MKWLLCAAVLVSLACGGDAAPSSTSRSAARSPETTASESDQGGVDVFDAAPPTRRDSIDAGRSSSARVMDAGMPRQRPETHDAATRTSSRSVAHDAGASPRSVADAMPAMVDAARADAAPAGGARSLPAAVDASQDSASSDASSSSDASPEVDAGSVTTLAMNTGSCCSTSAQPGCGDAALQACVCAQKVSCCIEAWDESCTRIIAEKFCQSGVRDCVCGTGEGQWQQAQCCEQRWDDTCDSVATNKCSATRDCQ